MTDDNQILKILLAHRGKFDAIGAKAIAEFLGWPLSRDRQVREIIEQCANRQWPGILCATPGSSGGYFFAADVEEVQAYRAYLQSLADAANDKINRLEGAMAREGLNAAFIREHEQYFAECNRQTSPERASTGTPAGTEPEENTADLATGTPNTS